MRACGIIAEYNPFHNGHQEHLMKARKQSGAEVIVVVMSGNFVQRGEVALIDKWRRAQAALASGADIVIELPFRFSAQAADIFADGAIRMLQALSCDSFSFGVEEDLVTETQTLLDLIFADELAFNQLFKATFDREVSYAQNMSQALEHLWKLNHPGQVMPVNFKAQPNILLAYRYLYSNSHPHNRNRMMRPVPIVRTTRHNSLDLQDKVASGTAIRKAFLTADEEINIRDFIPDAMFDLLDTKAVTNKEMLWPLLKYQLMAQSAESLRSIYLIDEGIENNLKKQVMRAESYQDFIQLVSNRRWPSSRVQRACLMILMQISRDEMCTWLNETDLPLRVLGFTVAGQSYLSQMKEIFNGKLISIANQSSRVALSDVLKVDSIYELLTAEIAQQNFGRVPIII